MPALDLQISGMTKRFGALAALQDVSMSVPAGSFHALLGENGAGKSTLVKCLVGFYTPDQGTVVIDGQDRLISSPKDADAAGIGMVYQHFTLVPSMTIAENLVISGSILPKFINWRDELEKLTELVRPLPFKVDLNTLVSRLSAGEKQKAEIVKQLYLKRRILILDEPTSVLTPDEADQVLGYIRELAKADQLTAIMITHKFGEVKAFADHVTVLRRGCNVCSAAVADISVPELAEAMIGASYEKKTTRGARQQIDVAWNNSLAIEDLTVTGDHGLPAVKNLSLCVEAGEIVGIAGVSGNGQRELVEALMGQRDRTGQVKIGDQPFHGTRREIRRAGVYGLPQEPLRNASVPSLTLAENMALRNFDRAPLCKSIFVDRSAINAQAERLVGQFRVKTSGIDALMSTLSGGNVQRAVLARELSNDVSVLIASNPTFGLDFVACEETLARILQARNAGAAVLLISEDLDELIGLVDRIVVMSEGRIVYEVGADSADKHVLGRYMAGSKDGPDSTSTVAAERGH